MHLVIAYDVVSNNRRARLMKFLKGYVDHVQKSVFEGEVSERKYEALREGIAKLIDKKTDTVRLYQLCGRCIPATEIIGTGVFVEDDSDTDILL